VTVFPDLSWQRALRSAAAGVSTLEREYQRLLRVQEPPPDVLVEHILQDQRNALDKLAHGVARRWGTRPQNSGFPLPRSSDEFDAHFNGQLPGIREARPEVVEAIRRHARYQPGHEWMDLLVALVNETKHRDYLPQTRVNEERLRVEGSAGRIEWDPARVHFGAGTTVNFGAPPTRVVYVDWLFDSPRVSVLGTLQEIQRGARELASDVAQAACVTPTGPGA
jgi:hypothetical protein